MQMDKTLDKNLIATDDIPISKDIFLDRERTNILRSTERAAVYFLVKRIPEFVTPNMLTGVGMVGSVMVLLAFILATNFGSNYMLLAIAGIGVNWLGDSLDGRLAYFRNIPRKWYGFSLDMIMDWISVVLIGFGYIIYAKEMYELLAFAFVSLYGWSMIISLIRYKITGKFIIDSGIVGPAELKVIISFIFLLEVLIPGSIHYCIMAICIILLLINLIDTNQLLNMGDLRDKVEKTSKKAID
jgi:phosphatidylglycerophosphate synthase